MHKTKNLFLVSLAATALLSACSSTKRRLFQVQSFPPGATIFVNGEPRGQTDEQRLLIDFPEEAHLVTLRLEKEGYQPTGVVLNWQSQGQYSFFLQEAPENRRLLESLNSIQRSLAQIAVQLEKQNSEKTQ